MNEADYRMNMAHAEECKANIRRIRAMDDPPGTPGRQSFARKTQHEWVEMVRYYHEALDIYRRFNQRREAEELLKDLLDLVEICDEHSSDLAIRLLLAVKDSIEWLETLVAGTKERVNILHREAIGKKLLEHEMDYWLLRSGLEYSRSLVNDETDRRTVDIALVQTMELAAQVCAKRGHLDGAEGWYRDAARIAQDRVGNADWASHLLQKAAKINLARSQRTSTATNGGTPSASIAEDLGQILSRSVDEMRKERFLPMIDEIREEYSNEPDKLKKLIADNRLILDRTALEARASKFRGKGLLGWVPGVFNAQGNPRGEYNIDELLTEQYVTEITKIIGALFHEWQGSNDISDQLMIAALKSGLPIFDWRLFENGLYNYFQGDYVSSSHILVPQFENMIRKGAETSGVQVMKFKAGVPGVVLLNDLINPQNEEMEQLLEPGLFDLIYWYFAKSDGPFGYRHKVAHGWLRWEECTTNHLSAMTVYLALRSIQKFTDKTP